MMRLSTSPRVLNSVKADSILFLNFAARLMERSAQGVRASRVHGHWLAPVAYTRMLGHFAFGGRRVSTTIITSCKWRTSIVKYVFVTLGCQFTQRSAAGRNRRWTRGWIHNAMMATLRKLRIFLLCEASLLKAADRQYHALIPDHVRCLDLRSSLYYHTNRRWHLNNLVDLWTSWASHCLKEECRVAWAVCTPHGHSCGVFHSLKKKEDKRSINRMMRVSYF